jgi:hypothetical protein
MMRVLALATFLALTMTACDDSQCPGAEQFVVNENGTCSSTPQQLTISSNTACEVFLSGAMSDTGLPPRGAMGSHPAPLRQGGFILFGDMPSFRLCRAQRVDYRLRLSCVDNDDAPVCQAELTEPAF